MKRDPVKFAHAIEMLLERAIRQVFDDRNYEYIFFKGETL